MPANSENSAVATGLEKVSFHSNPKEGNAKECSNYCTIALISHTRTSLVAQMVKRLSTMPETWVQSLGSEDTLEKEMAIHSRTIAWKIPWTEKLGRLQSMGSQIVGYD